MHNLDTLFEFLADLDKLKLVHRRTYVGDLSRQENSAEHSWHLAIALLIFQRELNLDIDLLKALQLAIIHDVCEIDAGDVAVFAPERADIHLAEQACIERLAKYDIKFAAELAPLWLEYEAQQSFESRWVRVLDRLLPFMVNLGTRGQTWLDQGISRSQVLHINRHIQEFTPEIFAWMVSKIDWAVAQGWLRDE